MTVTRVRLWPLVSALAACAPTLSGEPCSLQSNDCPANQICAPLGDGGGFCQAGGTATGTTSGATTSSTSGTSSASTTSSTSGTSSSTSGMVGIFGTVTLNGGVPLPPGAQAAVYAFAGSTDAGSAITANVNADGTYILRNPGNRAYTLEAYYAFSNGSNGTRSVFTAVPKLASTTPVNLDIPTYSCTIVSNEIPPDTHLIGALADVRDIATGDELATNVTATVSDPSNLSGFNPGLFTLQSANTNNLLNGQWGYVPGGAFSARPTLDQTYVFTIGAPGYGLTDAGVTCSVSTSTSSFPAPTFTLNDGGAIWYRGTQDIVSWSAPAAGYEFTYVEVRGPGDGGALPPLATAFTDAGFATFQGNVIPAATCPVISLNGHCVGDFSFFEPAVTLPSIFIQGHLVSQQFQTL